MSLPTVSRVYVATPTDEWKKIESWRFNRLLSVGYPVELAEQIAVSIEVDLHDACDLLARGCSPELAAEILL